MYSTVYAIYVTKLVRFQYSFVAIIVGMSIPITNPRQADLAARYRPKDTTAPKTSRLDALVRNYLRTSGQLADDQVEYGGATGGLGSRTADLLVGQGGVSDSLPLRAGAFATDVLSDPAWLIPGLGAAKAVKAGSDVAKMSPAVRQAYLSSIGRTLRHGSRDRNSFDVAPTGGQTGENFFDANFFATTSKDLAESSGYGAGRHHRVKMPLETARNLNMLDLYPGAPSVRDQFPHIADELKKMGNFESDISVIGSRALTKDPAALQRGLDDPRRYVAFSRGSSNVPNWNDWFSERGINAIRHQSGAYTNNNVTEPVFAFFKPQGLSAVPTRSPAQMLHEARRDSREYLASLRRKWRSRNFTNFETDSMPPGAFPKG